jgi:tetratricopeptide (TPR) repeat protein
VDGSVGPEEISHSTGLPEDRVGEALAKLHQLGAVRYDGDIARSGEGVRPAHSPTGAVTAEAKADAGTSEPNKPSGRFGNNHKRRVSDMLVAIEQQDHYELLGVPRDADKQTIKDAYFAVVSDFHPDKYFGQDLGENKGRLEKVFQRLTLAHDTLTRARRREEYDLTLPPAAERGLQSEGAPTAAPSVSVTFPSPAGQPVDARTPTVPPTTLRSSPNAREPTAQQHTAPPISPNPGDSDARRRALARKFQTGTSGQHSAPPSPSGTSPLTPPTSGSSGRVDAINLRGFRASDPAQRYLAAAKCAEEAGNVVGLANSLRLALSLDPENPAISQRLSAAESRMEIELADTFESQARSSESHRDYPNAARLFARAARGKQSSSLYLKAAECAKNVEGQLRQAGDYAKHAVALDPNNAQVRLFLGQIYAEAGMSSSALTELDKALRLSPEDDTIKTWLNRVKRGDV